MGLLGELGGRGQVIELHPWELVRHRKFGKYPAWQTSADSVRCEKAGISWHPSVELTQVEDPKKSYLESTDSRGDVRELT